MKRFKFKSVTVVQSFGFCYHGNFELSVAALLLSTELLSADVSKLLTQAIAHSDFYFKQEATKLSSHTKLVENHLVFSWLDCYDDGAGSSEAFAVFSTDSLKLNCPETVQKRVEI